MDRFDVAGLHRDNLELSLLFSTYIGLSFTNIRSFGPIKLISYLDCGMQNVFFFILFSHCAATQGKPSQDSRAKLTIKKEHNNSNSSSTEQPSPRCVNGDVKEIALEGIKCSSRKLLIFTDKLE